MASAVITKWGNSHALRIPSKIIKKFDINCNDKVYLEATEDKIIITKTPSMLIRLHLQNIVKLQPDTQGKF